MPSEGSATLSESKSSVPSKVSAPNLLTCTNFTVQIKEMCPVLAGGVLQHAAEDVQEGRGTALRDSSHRLLFLPVERGNTEVSSSRPSTREKHLVVKCHPKGPLKARSRGLCTCVYWQSHVCPNHPVASCQRGSQVLTSESDTGGESSMSGMASCLMAVLLLSLCSLALDSIT